ncbi:uncharacterized protein LOC124167616 [Ischnura elegans]|uniref:uncharacterized protein LOC124167616 n=1 Tax=Ischnura elegans TaxID=197161 RepID=UPI001ED86FA5|nr:uncharacterized protein LOC124167616 [Ischnura elegans]
MKVTAEQKYMLLQFIEGNANIAKNNLTNTFTAKDAMKLWQDVTCKLNACLGPVKTWKAWRKCWQDLKSTTKAKAAAYSREGCQTGGGAPQLNEPNDFMKRVIALIGKKCYTWS